MADVAAGRFTIPLTVSIEFVLADLRLHEDGRNSISTDALSLELAVPYHEDIALHHVEVSNHSQLVAAPTGFVKESAAPLKVLDTLNRLVIPESDKRTE